MGNIANGELNINYRAGIDSGDWCNTFAEQFVNQKVLVEDEDDFFMLKNCLSKCNKQEMKEIYEIV